MEKESFRFDREIVLSDFSLANLGTFFLHFDSGYTKIHQLGHGILLPVSVRRCES